MKVIGGHGPKADKREGKIDGGEKKKGSERRIVLRVFWKKLGKRSFCLSKISVVAEIGRMPQKGKKGEGVYKIRTSESPFEGKLGDFHSGQRWPEKAGRGPGVEGFRVR